MGKGIEGHNCTIANSKSKSYLIDCTYRQFFRDKYDKESHCGYYMVQDEMRRRVAEQILKYGWIEATPENIKAYMDGFEMAKRHSLEETGISPEEYVRMLEESEQWPMHIVTPKSICEAGEKEEITLENLNSGAEVVEGLVENLLGIDKPNKNPEEVGDD